MPEIIALILRAVLPSVQLSTGRPTDIEESCKRFAFSNIFLALIAPL